MFLVEWIAHLLVKKKSCKRCNFFINQSQKDAVHLNQSGAETKPVVNFADASFPALGAGLMARVLSVIFAFVMI